MLLKFCWHLADQMPFFVHLVNRLLYYLSVLYRWKSLQWECIRTSLSNNLLWFENQQQKIERSEQHLKMYVFYTYFKMVKRITETHGVWKSQKKSHSTLRAKRTTFLFWVDKSWLKNAQKWCILASFWKLEACGQTVLPDRSILIGQNLVGNAKIKKFKCDILSNFQTMWLRSHFIVDFQTTIKCVKG